MNPNCTFVHLQVSKLQQVMIRFASCASKFLDILRCENCMVPTYFGGLARFGVLLVHTTESSKWVQVFFGYFLVFSGYVFWFSGPGWSRMYNSHREGLTSSSFLGIFLVLPSLVLKTLHHSARPSYDTFTHLFSFDFRSRQRSF